MALKRDQTIDYKRLKSLMIGREKLGVLNDYDWVTDKACNNIDLELAPKPRIDMSSPMACNRDEFESADDSQQMRQCESESIFDDRTEPTTPPIQTKVFALQERFCMPNMLQLFELPITGRT